MRKLILLLLALFVIPTAFGLGISPADTRLSFTPGLDKVFTLRILNEEHQASQLSLELSGELAQYMQISQDKINVSENQASLEVVVSIKLPNAMEVGRKEGKITVVRDIPGAGISSRLAISHRVILDVPQEYGRVTALLNATPGLLIAQIRNPKETPASEVGFSIIVADGNNTLARFSQEGIELPAVSSRNIRIPLSSDKEGEFSADFSLTYMDEKYPEHKILMIGKPQPELSAETKNLLIGKVNPFKVEIKKFLGACSCIQKSKDHCFISAAGKITFA